MYTRLLPQVYVYLNPRRSLSFSMSVGIVRFIHGSSPVSGGQILRCEKDVPRRMAPILWEGQTIDLFFRRKCHLATGRSMARPTAWLLEVGILTFAVDL